MAQYEFQLSDYERIFRKRYMIVILTALCGAVFAVIIGRSKVPEFNASSSVKVDRTSTVRLGMESGEYDMWDNIETQTSVITSFPVLLKGAKKLGLVPLSTIEDTLPSDESILRVLEGLRAKIQASASSNIITISVTSYRREEARDIANAMAFSYKEFSLQQKRLFASKTKAFVTQQLELCKADLTEVEQSIAAFEAAQKIPSIGGDASRVIGESEKLEEQIKAVDNSIGVIKTQEEKLKEPFDPRNIRPRVNKDSALTADDSLSILSRMGWVSEFTDQDPGFMQLCNRLLQDELQYSDMSTFYKKDHPAVMDLEKKINETRDQILGQYGAKLAGLDKKMQALQDQKADNDRQMEMVPLDQMNYARLLRNLKVKEELYTMLTRKTRRP